ncbi:MAG TPA: hypothetical protein VGE34_03425 [Candidatus Saccharimonadales bacterium]
MQFVLYVVVFLCLFVVLFAYLTNPFNRFTIVRRSYRAEMKQSAIEAIDENKKLTIRQSLPHRAFAIIKNGIHILYSRWVKSPASSSDSIDDIISDIYSLRFDPTKLLLVSGDHFSALFVRNLGVFYYPTLDTNIQGTEKQWHDRQIVYLQTLAYALGVFQKQPTLTTTIVPTGRWSATCVNFYAYPSDTLYGMLYALASTLGAESSRPFSYSGENHHALDTIPAGKTLLKTYKKSLSEHYETYRKTVFDESLGLINPDVRMSGAKDITKRSSAFYDNVIFWKTTEIAMKLDLIKEDMDFLDQLKTRIVSAFWLEKEGYFLEDLSIEGKQEKYYSSDWLIVLATGFLDPEQSDEAAYFTRSIDYIRRKKIDRPFAIKYQHETRAHRQFAAVRLAVASYGGDSIWSFWGMEYIKALLVLYRSTDETWYLDEADYHIGKYEASIVKYNGFPELYDHAGEMLQTPLYRSIRQTGWVIGFDQVRAIRKTITQ